MDFYEFEGKNVFRKYNIKTSEEMLLTSPSDLKEFTYPCVVKSQVLSGKRGKAGGIKFAHNYEEMEEAVKEIFAMEVYGNKVDAILVAEMIDIAKEYYLGITIDPINKQSLLMFSPYGGMEIEELAEDEPDKIFKMNFTSEIDKDVLLEGIGEFNLDENIEKQLIEIIENLVILFNGVDATTVEINPLAVDGDNNLIAIDAKLVIDDNAMFRQDKYQLIDREEDKEEGVNKKAKDADLIYVDLDDDGNIISYFAIREDITAKKEVVDFNKTLYERINEEVAQNQKKDQLLLHQSKLAAMGEMIGAIAHQWRQPLNTLAIQMQFIEDDFDEGLIDAKYLREYSKESMKLVNFMSKTIDDFRNFFTVDKMKSTFDIKKKTDETINMLSAQLEGHNIKLTVEGESFSILGHSSEFQQVVLNIINNAKDALLEQEINEGAITINIEAKDDVGCVRISDNAGGIPKDVIERIFEPYFTTKEQGKGTGLGLYMSKMIIDNMSGKLSVQNNDLGAEFTIELKVTHE